MKKEIKSRIMKHLKLLSLGLTLSLWLLLAGCGSNTNSNLEGFFTPDKEWTEEIPSDAEMVSPEEFKKRVDAGELEIITPAILEAQEQAQQKSYQDNIAFLQGIPDKDPYISELLAEAAANPTFEGDSSTVGPDGETLLGLGTEINQAIETYKAMQSVENALDDYTLTYDLLPDSLKSQAATPESLEGKSLVEIEEALSNLNTLLGTLSATELDGIRLESNAGRFNLPALNAGNGTDNNGPCTLGANGLVSQFWFPLKNFVSPVKNQGGRGVCWAFAAIGAVESRERVQNDNPVNLSEQFFVNKVKEDWDSDDDTDGYWSEKALTEAAENNQALLDESGWTYNPSLSRPNQNDFAKSCDNYTGDCSLSSHQSRRTCTERLIGKNCAYVTYKFSGPGVAPSRITYLWRFGEDRFDLNRYRLLLSQGHVLLASFDVHPGFNNPNNGYVTDYTIDRNAGGHAVQIVGFISNEQLASATLPSGVPPTAGGGGYFIIKNSWGCFAGDGGYYYVPAQYVDTRFRQLSVLNFDARRSETWNYEQSVGPQPVNVEIKANPARVDVRVSTNLASFFAVTHPAATSVTLKVTDTTDGTKSIYNGPWTIRGGFSPTMPYTFLTPSTRRIEIEAQAINGGATTKAILNVNVVGNPPTLRLENTGSPQLGEAYSITALIHDVNENNSGVLCANTTWSVDAPDTLASTTGCLQTVTFGTLGNRQVRVSTRDSDGQTTSQTLTLTVLTPPDYPYPRITRAGVDAWDAIGGFCGNVSVPVGSTIDLRQKGCVDSVTPRDRYSANVEVENPADETLTYDWKLFYTDNGKDTLYRSASGSSDPSFSLRSIHNTGEATLDCRVTLQVNAPDPSRSKSLTVWLGRCTLNTFTVN